MNDLSLNYMLSFCSILDTKRKEISAFILFVISSVAEFHFYVKHFHVYENIDSFVHKHLKSVNFIKCSVIYELNCQVLRKPM